MVRKFFSVDLSLSNIFTLTTVMMAPKLANALGIRFNGDVFDYLGAFATQIINRKREEMAQGIGLGKAYSFIDLLLEAEVEQGFELANGKSKDNGKNSEKNRAIDELIFGSNKTKCKLFACKCLMLICTLQSSPTKS